MTKRRQQIKSLERIHGIAIALCGVNMIPAFLFGAIGLTPMFLFHMFFIVASGAVALWTEELLYGRKRSERRRIAKRKEINSGNY